MAIQQIPAASSSAAGEDFTLSVGASGNTKSDLGKSFGSGNYICTSSLSDSSLDIYLLGSDGSVAGYANATTATTTVVASAPFQYVVVYGATSNDTLTFQYKTVVSPASNSTSDLLIGPRAISISASSLKNIDDTTTITGQNFATNVAVAFTGTGYSSTAAKSIVRASSTSLLVTRPDNFPPSASPFTITVTNPGTVSPISTNSHILSNAVTAGAAPVWSTSASLPTFTRNSAYSTTLVATDEAGSTITYTAVSGSLPTGLSLNSSTGVISGTPTTALTTTYTVRATDQGGNFVDRAFTLTNAGPAWTTAAGQLALGTVSSAYSTTITATDDSGTAPTLSIISGSLPSGLSLNASSGAITGTPSAAPAEGTTFTVRATDANGLTADRAFSIPFARTQTFTSTTNWTAPAGVATVSGLIVAGGGSGGGGGSGWWYAGGGGGGGGATALSNQAVTPGATYTITVGGSGSASSISSIATSSAGATGGTSISSGNGAGGASGGNSGNGGAGFGSQGTAASGGTGYLWAVNGSYYGGGGGGGAGYCCWDPPSVPGNGGAGGGGRGGGGNGAGTTAGTANTGGGGGGSGGNSNNQQAGGSGIIIIRYNA
jgi:hypothetical protein